MKAFLEDEQTATPPETGDREAAHEAVERIRQCLTFVVLAVSLEDFILLYGGEVAGTPPRLLLTPGLTWEFEERILEADEKFLYIRRVTTHVPPKEKKHDFTHPAPPVSRSSAPGVSADAEGEAE